MKAKERKSVLSSSNQRLAIMGLFNTTGCASTPSNGVAFSGMGGDDKPKLSVAEFFHHIAPELRYERDKTIKVGDTSFNSFKLRTPASAGTQGHGQAITQDSPFLSSGDGSQQGTNAKQWQDAGGRLLKGLLEDLDEVARFADGRFSAALLKLARRYMIDYADSRLADDKVDRADWESLAYDHTSASAILNYMTCYGADESNARAEASKALTAHADGNGDYALEVIGVGDGMVTLGAQGAGKQSTVNFLSVLGDFDRVLAEAGADGQLTRDENNQVQVTNVSTAQAYLLQLANNGAPVTSDDALAIARESLDNGKLLTMAAAIRLSVDGGYPLPPGTPDTLALISDPDALDAFLDDVEADDPEALTQTINAIVSDPSLIVQSDATDLLGTYTLAYHLGVAGTVNTGNIQGERLMLAADGGGAFVGSVPNADPSLEWSFDGETGRAVAIPNTPTVLRNYPVIDGIGQVPQDMSVTRIEVAMLFEGNGRDTLAVTKTSTFTYPDNPELEGGTQTTTATNLGIRDEDGLLPFSAGELAGTSRSMWISGVPYQGSNFSGSEMFSFDADGTGVRGDDVAFEWGIDALGRLQVGYADGTASSYGRVQQDGRKGESLAAEWRDGNGDHSAALSISAVGDGFAFRRGVTLDMRMDTDTAGAASDARHHPTVCVPDARLWLRIRHRAGVGQEMAPSRRLPGEGWSSK